MLTTWSSSYKTERGLFNDNAHALIEQYVNDETSHDTKTFALPKFLFGT